VNYGNNLQASLLFVGKAPSNRVEHHRRMLHLDKNDFAWNRALDQ